MEERFPKRLFQHGEDPQVMKINSSCKITLLKASEEALPTEYKEVSTSSVFAYILALRRNNLGYSRRLVHTMLCRQLVNKKAHEFWCIFGGIPMRFSLQEFHYVTSLNCLGDFISGDLDNWEDDNRFWAKVLKNRSKINIIDFKKTHLQPAKTWEPADKLRLVYFCVIAGFVLVEDENTHISQPKLNW